MVMVPVGNRTRHNFSLWTFFEVYVRSLISAVVLFRGNEVLQNGSETALCIILSIWTIRPLYISIKYLYNSWRDAKHRAECDAVSEAHE